MFLRSSATWTCGLQLLIQICSECLESVGIVWYLVWKNPTNSVSRNPAAFISNVRYSQNLKYMPGSTALYGLYYNLIQYLCYGKQSWRKPPSRSDH